MARIRTIKPEFASDRKLASISRGARLTFVLLITQADDDGLVLGSPRQLLGQLYPHDESVDLATLSRELRELRAIGLLEVRETVDNAPVIELTNWRKHQRIDHKAKSLILPHLAPLSDEPRDILARVSRESRAPTLDLGPRTMDLGATAPLSPNEPAKGAVRETRTPSEPVENWPAAVAARWCASVGVIREGRVGKDLKPAYRQFGLPILLRAVDSFAYHRRLALAAGNDKPDNWPQFVRDFTDYVPKTVLASVRDNAADANVGPARGKETASANPSDTSEAA